jgi:hypothetical protein
MESRGPARHASNLEKSSGKYDLTELKLVVLIN